MIRRGLGRGLEALIPGAAAEPAGAATEIDVFRIVPNPFQPRRDFSGPEFDELVASVRRHGVLQPVMVRPKDTGYELVAGERRWRAAKDAGLVTIPAVVKSIADREMLEFALIENLKRADLNPIERALAYRRLSDDFQLTQDQVAEAVGSSRPSVANTLRLLDLPSEVQLSLTQGRISEGHGRALLMAPDEKAILEVWKQVEARAFSVRETEALVQERARRVSRETSGRRGRRRDPQLLDLELQLRERYTTTAAIRGKASRGTIELRYFSAQDLERLIDLLLR
ncbi:MAG TPA: ParB/RepB/Spo0J family partition protein [bacterium]|nr:ParB/RepB/Spo0J family partition protein [bacterium]